MELNELDKEKLDSMLLYLTFMRNEPNNPLEFDKYLFNTKAHSSAKWWGLKLNEIVKNENRSQSLNTPTINPPIDQPTMLPLHQP